MLDFAAIAALQEACVARWHEQPLDNPARGFWPGVRAAPLQFPALARRGQGPLAGCQRRRDRRGQAGDRPAQPAAERLDRAAGRVDRRRAGPPRHAAAGGRAAEYRDARQHDRPAVRSWPCGSITSASRSSRADATRRTSRGGRPEARSWPRSSTTNCPARRSSWPTICSPAASGTRPTGSSRCTTTRRSIRICTASR